MVAAPACSEDDVFPRDEFVSKLVESGVEAPVGECVYSAIKRDTAVQKDLVRAGGPNEDITNKSANKLKRIVAKCILDANGDTTGGGS